MKRKDYLEILEGQEFLSLSFEGCVGIHDGKLWKCGIVLLSYINKATLSLLFSEMCRAEGI